MAVLLELLVTPATQESFDSLDAKVEQAMADAGGTPPGLMSHVVYPAGDVFVVADAWRTESQGRSYVDDVLHLLMAETGLTPNEATTLRPVWSFARP